MPTTPTRGNMLSIQFLQACVCKGMNYTEYARAAKALASVQPSIHVYAEESHYSTEVVHACTPNVSRHWKCNEPN